MVEARLERRLRQVVKRHNGKALKFVSPGMAGVPDRIVLLPSGRAIFAELKAPGEPLKPLQRKRATELRALGFKVYCLDSAAALDDFIKEVFQ